MSESKSLCQTCFCFDCSWHEEFEPVKGWTAKPTLIYNTRNNGRNPTKVTPIKSYQVSACPLYVNGYEICNKSITLDEIAKANMTSASSVRRKLRDGKKIYVSGKKVISIKSGNKIKYFLEN